MKDYPVKGEKIASGLLLQRCTPRKLSVTAQEEVEVATNAVRQC